MKIKTQSILLIMVVALVTVGCGHHSHHRDQESLTGKVIKYPFRMTGYVIGAPFHPLESTRKAFNATIDIPEKAVSSTSDALFGHDHDHHHDDQRTDIYHLYIVYSWLAPKRRVFKTEVIFKMFRIVSKKFIKSKKKCQKK